MPAKAGIQDAGRSSFVSWIPAFAGMTNQYFAVTLESRTGNRWLGNDEIN